MNKVTLEILQYNVHRSKDVVTVDFLRNPRVLEADVIAIQEPWDNPVGCIDTIMKLEGILGRAATSYVIVGDFNLHHPAWGGEEAV
ncbi:hypothetical protein N7467_001979 [Penicillium canescens]|nr:hypothetical protein N7467_001979 [Penicillium canescens]